MRFIVKSLLTTTGGLRNSSMSQPVKFRIRMDSFNEIGSDFGEQAKAIERLKERCKDDRTSVHV
ncbi:MAG: hypothetical protein EA377_02085 [Phycisphaerales bacterium]|nr:MAG: hypothetical protein EA377_02085 [Phycisphaerales bacterium]